MAKNATHNNDNGDEGPRASLNTKRRWISSHGRNCSLRRLTVSGPKSKVSAEAQALPYPEPCNILPPLHCTHTHIMRSFPCWCSCPGHCHDSRYFRGRQEKNWGVEEGLRTSIPLFSLYNCLLRVSQRGVVYPQILSLLCPPLHSYMFSKTQHRFIFCCLLKKKKKKKKITK